MFALHSNESTFAVQSRVRPKIRRLSIFNVSETEGPVKRQPRSQSGNDKFLFLVHSLKMITFFFSLPFVGVAEQPVS